MQQLAVHAIQKYYVIEIRTIRNYVYRMWQYNAKYCIYISE